MSDIERKSEFPTLETEAPLLKIPGKIGLNEMSNHVCKEQFKFTASVGEGGRWVGGERGEGWEGGGGVA